MPPLAPDAWLRPPTVSLPFPVGEPGTILGSRARHGLWHVLRGLGLRPGDAVLAPAYHHGSEIEVMVRAGLEVRFYSGHADLSPDPLELDRLCDDATRALYLIHPMGFPQDTPGWRRWCDERGLLLVEDAAMGWLGSVDHHPLGALGDGAIFCLYKTYGLPDGAAAVIRSSAGATPGPVEQGRLPGRTGRATARAHLRWLSQLGAPVGAARRRPDHLADIAMGDVRTGPSPVALHLLPRVVDARTASLRRSNAARLVEQLGDAVPAPFDRVDPGAAPFALPITAPDKDRLLHVLAERGVDALDLWSRPHPSLPWGRFPDVDHRRRSTVGLPVHQALRPLDVERIADAVRPRPRRAMRVDVADRLEDVAELAGGWTALAAEQGNIFSTWEWAATWHEHLGAGHRLRIVVCTAPNGRLIAVVPLYLVRRGAVTVARFVGHGPADQLGPVCAPHDLGRVARVVRAAVADLAPAVLLAEHVPTADAWAARLGGRVLRSEAAPVATLAGLDWDGYLGRRSSNLRQQVRRFERRLVERRGATFRCGTTPEGLGQDLDTLFGLHAERWPGEQSQFDGTARAFHEAFAAVALQRGWLRLLTCEVEGDAVASWYGFRFAGVESYYQAGRRSTWAGEPVGLALLARSIRLALEDGVLEYRFLRGAEGFKYRFADHDPGLETVGVGHGGAGRAAMALLAGLPDRAVSPLRRWTAD